METGGLFMPGENSIGKCLEHLDLSSVRPVLDRRLGEMTSRGPLQLGSFPISLSWQGDAFSLCPAAHEFSIASLSMGRLQPLSLWFTQQWCQARSCSITLWGAPLAEADQHACVSPTLLSTHRGHYHWTKTGFQIQLTKQSLGTIQHTLSLWKSPLM